MTLISYTYNLQNATPEDVTQVMANFTTIRNAVNGNLEDANVKTAAAIAASKIAAGYLPSKLAQEGAAAGQAMIWDNANAKWAPGTLAAGLLSRQASEVTISNTAAETDLFRYAVPGGTLGTDKAIWVTLRGTYNNNSAANRTFTFRVKYGATTLFADDSAALASNANDRAWTCELFLSTRGSTGSEIAVGYLQMGAPSAASNGIGDFTTNDAINGAFSGTATEDSTASKDLAVTFQHSAANASLTMKQYYASAVLLG